MENGTEYINDLTEVERNVYANLYFKYIASYIMRAYQFDRKQLNEDVIEEGYIGMAQGLLTYKKDQGTSVRTYLTTCAMNQVANYLNSKQYKHHQHTAAPNITGECIDILLDHALNPEEQLLQKENDQERARIMTNVLRSTLKTLDDRSRYVLRHCIMGDKSNVEVAERFDCSEGMIRYLIKKIKIVLNEKGDKMYDKIQNADL